MDSLTQIVLGASVAAVSVPAQHRRKALVAGAVLGTLPDLDVLWFSLAGSDAVTSVTWHRGPSHSLAVLAIVGWLLWLLGRRWSVAVRESPWRWLLAIWLALLTHPLLDAFTVYGTQLLWPLATPPVMGSTVFVIDPIYTVPLLVATVMCWLRSGRACEMSVSAAMSARRWLVGGLVASSLYLGWSLGAKLWVDRVAQRGLSAIGVADAPRFSTPLPLNTLAWRVVAMVPGGYYVGDRSLMADRGDMRFVFHASETEALDALAHQSADLRRLLWFTQGFVGVREQSSGEARAPEESRQLIVSDLRMGLEPDYHFRYEVATRSSPDAPWRPVETITRVAAENGRAATLGWVWRRIWRSDAQP